MPIANSLSRWLWVGAFWCVAIGAQAAIGWQLPAEVRTVYSSEAQENDYLLMLGIYRRINNEWRTQGAETVSGNVIRKTLELPRGADEREFFGQLKSQIPNRRELFSCTGLLCGTSNAWANTHFGKRVLYGLDTQQYYGVYELERPEGLHYVVLYVVRRGNGSVMAQIEEIAPAGSSARLVTPAKSIANAVQEQGYFSIPLDYAINKRVEVSAEQLQQLVDFMHSDGGSFTLVGHDYRPGVEHIEAATEHAMAVKVLLEQRGLRAPIRVFSVGRNAPAGRGTSVIRVDLVRQ